MCEKKTSNTELVMKESGEKVSSDILSKKIDLDIKQANIAVKAGMCRETMNKFFKYVFISKTILLHNSILC